MNSNKPCNDYSALHSDHVSREEAVRALEDYIRRRYYKLEMPEALEEFILDGLERQLIEGAPGWHDDKGRPKLDPPFNVELLAWYCFYVDANFKNGNLQGETDTEARYERISDHLIERLAQDGVIPSGLSSPSVKRMVRRFKRVGFHKKLAPYRPLTADAERSSKIGIATAFCRDVLELDYEQADAHAVEIVDCWDRGQK